MKLINDFHEALTCHNRDDQVLSGFRYYSLAFECLLINEDGDTEFTYYCMVCNKFMIFMILICTRSIMDHYMTTL